MKNRVFFLAALLIFLLATPAYAHPGNTASDGCHYCRTNCDRWGVPWNERHCHGGGAAIPVEQTQQIVYPTSTPILIKPTNTPLPINTPTPTDMPTTTLIPTQILIPTATITPTKKTVKLALAQTSKESFWRQLVRFLLNF